MSGVQYSGQGRERLITATAATSDPNGAITFRVGPCPLGFVWQGSATVTGAPSGALFTSSVGSTPWGQHAGSTNFGPVQLWGNETLIMTGVGLQKNTQYSLLFVGVAMPDYMAEPLPPVAPLSTVSVETSTKLVSGQVFSGAGSVILTPPSLTRRLTVVVASGSALSTLVALVGNQSGANYGSGTFNSVDGPDVFYFAIEPTIDQTYTLSFSGTVACTAWVTANTTSPLVTTEANQPLVIAQPVLVTIGSQPINVAGSPVGVFKTSFTAVLTNGGNQQVIAAPAAGQSIYLQTWHMSASAGAIGNTAELHPAGGAIFSSIVAATASHSQTIPYPGGYEIAAATALQVDIIGTPGIVRISGTYVVGTAI